MAPYSVIIAALGIGLLEGSEIAMLTLAAASKYKWRKAWLVTFAGLLTLIPLLAVLYFFFTAIPIDIAELLAGIIIFLLGAHFFSEGLTARKEKKSAKKEKEEEEEKIGAGLIGVYSAIILEEAEAGSITISIAVAAGGAYAYAFGGALVGILIPLAAISALKPIMERIPEWIFQTAVGAIMMVVALAIILYHF